MNPANQARAVRRAAIALAESGGMMSKERLCQIIDGRRFPGASLSDAATQALTAFEFAGRAVIRLGRHIVDGKEIEYGCYQQGKTTSAAGYSATAYLPTTENRSPAGTGLLIGGDELPNIDGEGKEIWGLGVGATFVGPDNYKNTIYGATDNLGYVAIETPGLDRILGVTIQFGYPDEAALPGLESS